MIIVLSKEGAALQRWISKPKRAKRKELIFNKKMQGNRLQVKQEWVLFRQKTQQIDIWQI